MNRTGLFLFIAVVILAVAAYWYLNKPKAEGEAVEGATVEGEAAPAEAAPAEAAPAEGEAAPAHVAISDWQPPQRIVYVSCNPSTLARDAGLLVHQAGYRCTAAGVINMFPHTAHVESMAVFERVVE